MKLYFKNAGSRFRQGMLLHRIHSKKAFYFLYFSNSRAPGLDKECCSIEFIQRKPFISFILAIAELLENDGNDELRKKDKECCSIEFIQRKPFISFILAIAELLENDGNDELRKKDFRNAIFLYTQGIQIDCKDRELKAKLYSNRATAYFNLGEKKVLRFSSFFQVSILSQKF